MSEWLTVLYLQVKNDIYKTFAHKEMNDATNQR